MRPQSQTLPSPLLLPTPFTIHQFYRINFNYLAFFKPSNQIATYAELNKPAVESTAFLTLHPTRLANANMSTADETSKDGKWNNDAHTALCTALAEALIAAGSSAAQKKELIMAVMRASGQNGFTWESIR